MQNIPKMHHQSAAYHIRQLYCMLLSRDL